MRLALLIIGPLVLSGCSTAAEREARDDRVCVNARDYAICRQNLMSSRRDDAVIGSRNVYVYTQPRM